MAVKLGLLNLPFKLLERLTHHALIYSAPCRWGGRETWALSFVIFFFFNLVLAFLLKGL